MVFILIGEGIILETAIKFLIKKKFSKKIIIFSIDSKRFKKKYSFKKIIYKNLSTFKKFSSNLPNNIDFLLSLNSRFIFTNKILKKIRYAAINFHPGTLPKYGGLFCHQWAIRNGEKKINLNFHKIIEKLDAGPIILKKKIDIKNNDTGLTLWKKCLQDGSILLIKLLKAIEKNPNLKLTPQKEKNIKIYTYKKATESKINWKWSPKKLINFCRASDYKPFKSPTYEPIINLKTGPKVILKIVESKKILFKRSAKPGDYLNISNNCKIVKCGVNSQSVKVFYQ